MERTPCTHHGFDNNEEATRPFVKFKSEEFLPDKIFAYTLTLFYAIDHFGEKCTLGTYISI
jgi:hypothetical protein